MCRRPVVAVGRRIDQVAGVPDIVLTADELEALSRCSGVAVKAYLRLRARMDFRTGIVGHRSGMSYQALREWTEETVEKGAGVVVMQPTLRNIRTAVDQLLRRGLLSRMRTERLVFRCLMARTGEVRPNRTRHEPGRANRAEPGTHRRSVNSVYFSGGVYRLERRRARWRKQCRCGPTGRPDDRRRGA